MQTLSQLVAHFVECLRDQSQFQQPADKDSSIYLNPELQPLRDILWELTGCYDAEALDLTLQD